MGNEQHGLLGCVGCFLVPALVRHPWWVVGVGAYFWVGHKKFDEQTHCRVHVQHRVSVRRRCGGGCPRSQLMIVVLLVWVVCGGLFVICIVVASIFVLYCFLCFV